MAARYLPLLILLLLLLGGCAGTPDTDDGAGFTGFRDYGWQTG